MELFRSLATLECLVLTACQGVYAPDATVAADGRVLSVAGGSRTPASLVRAAGIQTGTSDIVLNNGLLVSPDKPIPVGDAIRLQVVRPQPVLINSRPVLTTAHTVGEALQQSGLALFAADSLNPPADTSLIPGMLISFAESTSIQTFSDGVTSALRASARAHGAALAQAGVPIEGLDRMTPGELEPASSGGEVRVSRVTDFLQVSAEPIPFASVSTDAGELDLGVEQVLQPGIPGLQVSGTRIRREDGVEVSRQSSGPTVISEPENRLVRARHKAG